MPYKRRVVREKVLQALYAYELSKEPIEKIIQEVLTLSQPEARAFAERLIRAVVDHQEEIDSTIKRKVAHWEFNRIAVVDRILLQIGISEFLYFEDIPPKVTINEAIEIAKRFSTEKSGHFINGVLDSILADLKTNGRIKKTGRGLIDVTIPSKNKTSPVKED
jgi:N utilization substance protein B